MAKQKEPIELYSAWNAGDGIGAALSALYSDGLQQYWDWLGDSFFPFFGVDDYGQAKVGDLDADATEEEKNYYLAAIDLASKLNYINTEIFDVPRGPDGESLASASWPGDNLVVYTYDYYKNEVIPVLKLIIEDLKVVQENILISQPEKFDDVFQFGGAPPDDLPELIESVIDALPSFLENFPDVSISLKTDVPPVPDTQGLGPAPIFSDVNLEKSLFGGLSTEGSPYYIGFLLDPKKSGGKRDKPYLPVRLSPEKEKIAYGWFDRDYSLIDNDGDEVKPKNKDSNGIEIPLGLEITITEIVPSDTGIWVGFVSEDERLDDSDYADWDDVTADQTRVLYTKAQYVRIKESFISLAPDPYLSERAKVGDDQTAFSAGFSGTDPVNPKDNQLWFTAMPPNDVRLNYYYFHDHNIKKVGKGEEDDLIYNSDTLDTAQTLRYSEGYYYFISGELPRKSEAELINESDNELLEDTPSELEAAKSQAALDTMSAIKEEAWNNLLAYLGKNVEGGNSNLYQQIKDKYFVLVDKKVNTNSSNPNNEKALFAVRASYVDALPETRRAYKDDFEQDSPFLNGKNYAVSVFTKEIEKRCKYLVGVLRKLQNNIENSKSTGLKLENANGTDYDIKVQIELMEDFPFIIKNFLQRQSFPASTNRSYIYDLVRESMDTSDNHIVQFGIKDNDEVGGGVRETLSYVIFSPDPEKLKEGESDSNLFYFDPFLTKDQIEKKEAMKRSGVSLRTALPWVRDELEGVYGSRTLHLFLAHDKIKKQLTSISDTQDNWTTFFHSFLVPPVRIYPSKDPSLYEPEELTCDEIIERLNRSGPNTGTEERLLQERLYNDPKCMAKYYNQFKSDTSATSPELSKKELEKKSDQLASGQRGSIMQNQYVKVLYTGFFNVIDINSLIAMIMACLQNKLGLEITAEAICERAISELLKPKSQGGIGPEGVQGAMLAAALLAPDDPNSQAFLAAYQGTPPFAPPAGAPEKEVEQFQPGVDDPLTYFRELDESYNNAPIATAMLMSEKESGLVAETIKSLEKGGVYIELVPGPRPGKTGFMDIPSSTPGAGLAASASDIFLSTRYTLVEIEAEKKRLISIGYSESEARALLVSSGYLVPSPKQYESILGTDNFSSPVDKFSTNLRAGNLSGAVDYSTVENIRAVGQTADNWLKYMKGAIGLAGICELLVGTVLEGLQDLLKDPAAFFSNPDLTDSSKWDWLNQLKKQYQPPSMTMRFPDNLMTDNHMGDYDTQLYKALLSLVATILGQIVSLLVRQALEQCLEDGSDLGPGPSPIKNLPPDIPIPTLERAGLPRLRDKEGLPVSDSDVVAWMKDVLDRQSPDQLCALLNGDATKQTLRAVLQRTKSNWAVIYENGVDTIYEIRVIFENLGKELNLDICDVLQAPTANFIENICDAYFDTDARCAQLKMAGLTEQECQEQIDGELEDLKNKVADLASLSFLDINPIGSFTIPPICGEGGSFVVPPGVRDTMTRITDNMLTAIKGSLTIDMTGLKFFATPPRAILAMTDPEELTNAHKMFMDAVQDPYKKECMALIGCPSNTRERLQAGDSENAEDYKLHNIYPLTYNKFIHYGNFSTWWDDKETSVHLAGATEEEIALAQAEAEAQALIAYNEKVDNLEQELSDELTAIFNDLVENGLKDTWGGLNPYYLGTKKSLGMPCKEKPAFGPSFGADCHHHVFDEETHTIHVTTLGMLIMELGKDGGSSEFLTKIMEQYKNFQADLFKPGPWGLVEIDPEATDALGPEFAALSQLPAGINFLSSYMALTSEANQVKQATYEDVYQQEIDKFLEGKKLASSFEEEHINQFVLSDTALLKDLREHWSKRLGGNSFEDQSFFETNQIAPMHAGCLLPRITPPGATSKDGWSIAPHGTNETVEPVDGSTSSILALSNAISQKILDVATPNLPNPNASNLHKKSKKYLERGQGLEKFIEDLVEKTQGDREEINRLIAEEFNKNMQPMHLDLLTISPQQSFKGPLYANTRGNTNYGAFPGNVSSPIGGRNQDAGGPNAANIDKGFLKKVYPLDMKLKDIHPNPVMWYGMLRAYTGVKINPFGSNAAADGRVFPRTWLNGKDEDGAHLFSDEVFDPQDPQSFYQAFEDKYLSSTPIGDDEKTDALIDKGNRHWYNWLKFSPGLRNLMPTMFEREQKGQGEQTFPVGTGDSTFVGQHNVAFAFMELTLAEAIGLDYARARKIFPNLQDVITNAKGVIFGMGHPRVQVVRQISHVSLGETTEPEAITESITWTDSWARCFFPMSIVFERHFRDPNNLLNGNPDDLVDYFSMNGSPVNQELLNFFDSFPTYMGFDNPEEQWKAINRLDDTDPTESVADSDNNFNPNILKYDLPFTELISKDVPGLIDGQAKTNEILDILRDPAGGDEMQLLAEQLESVELGRSLINQNVATPLGDNYVKQTAGVKNTSKLIKAATDRSNVSVSAEVVLEDSLLSKEIYNVNFFDDLDPEVKGLIDKIWPTGASTSEELGQAYASDFAPGSGFDLNDVSAYGTTLGKMGNATVNPFALRPENYKAHIFGMLLTHKFSQKFNEYYNSSLAYDKDYVDNNINVFARQLKNVLSTYGYSALQYGYSTQMFAKLKKSRLHNRGFMKKLWKKILKSPLDSTSGTGVDPRCRQLFDQLSVTPTKDLEGTETDFFKLDDIKPKILEFYENSLCRDVYESNLKGDNSTRVSLIEGMVTLIAKVYTLEMALAAVIAWDSFDLLDVIKDKSMIAVITRNIHQDYNEEWLAFYAADIIRKEEGFSDVELAKLRKGGDIADDLKGSSLETLILREAEHISAVIKDMFVNSSPLTTELEVSLTRNSDHDYPQEFVKKVTKSTVMKQAFEDSTSIIDGAKETAHEHALLHSVGDYSYVTDVKLKDNIYTMNYNSPPEKIYPLDARDTYEPAHGDEELPYYRSDIFGLHVEAQGNKSHFHSVPMTFRGTEDSGDKNYAQNYFDETGGTGGSFGPAVDSSKYNMYKGFWPKSTSDATLKSVVTLQKERLGNADAFSHENFQEVTHGNNLNAKLGNITFQPYVRVVDYDPGEEREFLAKVNYTSDGDDPCEDETAATVFDFGDYLSTFEEEMNKYRIENGNPFGCHIYDCIPLSVWSHFYNNVFLTFIHEYQPPEGGPDAGTYPLKEIFNEHGLAPFFKSVSFGMRMMYSTSYPVTTAPALNFDKFMESSLAKGPAVEGLKNAKCIYGHRPYYISLEKASVRRGVLREIQIPIVEIEKQIKPKGRNFVLQDGGIYHMDDLGRYAPSIAGIENFVTISSLLNPEQSAWLKNLTKNPHQFFYKNLANELLGEIKNSAEFKLMFEYLFPMNRYMSLAFIVASDGLSKFIPEPTAILDKTKGTLFSVIDNLNNSVDYKHISDPVANMIANQLLRAQGGTSGKEPDMTKEILRIILRTSLLVLKGFVEMTDPAVRVAKTIIDIANAIQVATIAAIKKGIQTAKQIVQAGIDAAKAIKQQLEMQLRISIGLVGAKVATLPEPQGEMTKEDIVIYKGAEDLPISEWVEPNLYIANRDIIQQNVSQMQWKEWSAFLEEFDEMTDLVDDFRKADEDLVELEQKKKDIEEKAEVTLRKAENTMKDIFTSPYLLPGMWAALVPPFVPLGGGIVPGPPITPSGPFPSTVPGMIYIALLLIDAIEEKMHDDMQKLSNEDEEACEDEL